MTKTRMRQEMILRRRAMSAAVAERCSRQAQRRFVQLPEFASARVVAVYLAMPGEVETDRILAAAWAAGKLVAVPAWRTEAGRYEWTEIREADAVGPGPWRTLEPEPKRWMTMREIGIIAVPGVAFDAQGRRLGRGGGHYDRLLADAGEVVKVGLLFDMQRVEAVPVSRWDVSMNKLVTDKGVLVV